MSNPLVSVIMITYAHEDYIREAINGVFIQETNFPVELIIANDCSPDSSDQIIKDAVKEKPGHISVNYTRHAENLGMMENHHWALNQAKGKYIAFCDGDDYWIERNKLQIQIDFLESNPDFNICCHNFKVRTGNTVADESFFDKIDIKEVSDIVDLSKNNTVATLSAVVRNMDINLPAWSGDAPLADLIFFMHTAKTGKIKYLNEKMAVYRKDVGVWHKNKVNHEKMIFLFNSLANDFIDNEEIKKNLFHHEKKHIKASLKELNFRELIKDDNLYKLSLIEKMKIFLYKVLLTVDPQAGIR